MLRVGARAGLNLNWAAYDIRPDRATLPEAARQQAGKKVKQAISDIEREARKHLIREAILVGLYEQQQPPAQDSRATTKPYRGGCRRTSYFW